MERHAESPMPMMIWRAPSASEKASIFIGSVRGSNQIAGMVNAPPETAEARSPNQPPVRAPKDGSTDTPSRQQISFYRYMNGFVKGAGYPDSAFAAGRLQLRHGDVTATITAVADAGVDAVLHDPPRFGIAGELYSLAFYQQLARVIRPGGKLFHYTGSPNKLTTGRDVPAEVVKRLEQAGFRAEKALDGVFAVRR